MGRSGYTCVRYIFCYLNIILWLSACGVLGVGVWLNYSHNGYTTLLPQYALVGADSLLITIGATLFIITFFGCCGSWCQSRCLLITYFTLVIFLFMAEFMLATLAFVFREKLGLTMKDELLYGIEEHYLNPPDNGMEVIWDHIQREDSRLDNPANTLTAFFCHVKDFFAALELPQRRTPLPISHQRSQSSYYFTDTVCRSTASLCHNCSALEVIVTHIELTVLISLSQEEPVPERYFKDAIVRLITPTTAASLDS
ncbi:Tetraspanin-9 [Homalodisca vitripennis]|nr:Tetraspanin-9 [Homalodisca vitripennis]